LPRRLFRALASSPAAPRIRLAAGLLELTTGRPRLVLPWLSSIIRDSAADGRLRAVALHAGSLAAVALGEPAAEREFRLATLSLVVKPEVGRFLAARTLFPMSPSILGLDLADLMVRQKSLDGAIRMLEWLRRIVRGDEAILSRLAELHFKAGHLGDALGTLDELAAHHRDAGRLEQMAAVLDRMSSMAPHNIDVKTKLINAYLQRGFVEQARRELEQRAQLQEASGKLTDAIASLQQAADICWTLGRHNDAFSLAERMIGIQPSNSDARQYLITLYLQAGRIREAVEHTWELANMHLATGNQRDAIAALHQIIGLDPSDAAAHHRLGETLASISEYAQAERVYRRLVRDHPDDQVARARLVAMAALVGQHDAA
jgi:tetratricopeptide (TPR) repeat protein